MTNDLHSAHRELRKWLNEKQTKPIDRAALATVLQAIEGLAANQTTPKEPAAPAWITASEQLADLRENVRVAWLTGVPNFREAYDESLLGVLGIRYFSDLQKADSAAQKEKTCTHEIKRPEQDYIQCVSCGAVKHHAAGNGWHKSLAHAIRYIRS